MNPLAMHLLFGLPERNRNRKTFWISEKKYKRMFREKHRGFGYQSQLVKEKTTNGKKYYQMELMPDRIERNGKYPLYVSCLCGFKGEGQLQVVTKKRKNVKVERLLPTCPACGNQTFQELRNGVVNVKYADIYRDEDKISLSFALQTKKYNRHFDQTTQKFYWKFQNFENVIRLTYNYKKKVLYFVMPRNKIVQNVSYGHLSLLQIHLMQEFISSEKGKKKMQEFLWKCLKQAGVHEKKRKNLIRKMDNEGFWFRKSPYSSEKLVFPLLTMPQLQAIDNKHFVLSVASAPRSVKKKIRNSENSARDIFQQLYGYSNKRLVKFCAEDNYNFYLVQLFRPLFTNDVYLMDFLGSLNRKGKEFIDYQRLQDDDFIDTRLFKAAVSFRKKVLPLLKNLKKKLKDERVLRNELIRLYQSDYCQLSPYRFLCFMEDTFNMEQALLKIIPPEKMPVRTEITALHDAYAREINANQEILNALENEEKEQSFIYLEQEKALEEKGKACDIRLAASPIDLANIGKQLSNCVRSYKEKINEKKSLIFAMEVEGVPQVCLEVRIGKKRWELTQASGKGNSRLDNHKKDLLVNWINTRFIDDPYELISKEGKRMPEFDEQAYQEYRKEVNAHTRSMESKEVIAKAVRIAARPKDTQNYSTPFLEVSDDDLPF